ncbi:SWIM zinc finger family protein [Ornithinimicrobium cavernae]|uniref:SWIM zinc finger family protein n=1 Tax=Ornithinimicrobium cavernae TaxID=2666047 RepID=UPI000D68A28E|nr:SWIM zinc finger family protein [Ornithinimicrobium cavernae]
MSDWFPPPSRPRAVEGGLRARSKRGAIAQQWWSQRFIQVLESMGIGGRLARGRNYARRGQVLELQLDTGAVTARVQGSRARPYRVRVGVPAFGKADWTRVSQALAGDAWYTAKLLSGEMPPDIEELFAGLGLSLFPAGAAELTMDCSCPDWGVPCKHLAAVLYLLAEHFDEDPFAILALRGRDRETLLGAVSALRGGAPADDGEASAGALPLADCLETFFAMPTGLPGRADQGVDPAPPDALLDQLPAVDVTVRGTPLIEALRPVYATPAG